ncbi:MULTISPECIES: TetR/AcrR family transcriptional regulator [unclassified Cobetia]|uniref:TetR/AcrR family transcriptional regulator n=1 Tax=unclassified Cobetia TaxID=2609414 RepID=UPI002097B5E9|nr:MULTISPECIES: TetR family transcriptional regulator C-terminal domain-containing protein [unclassified Cobetia]MCO7231493.1 TetR family transcriptional regulator C-terminal domain-containing protein [Cobetia sp. Dlab-2-AX]MCO7235192.1 TetR family transcriptional regulator C-terminal domain-containing protein [Cobetia sp. Dlab-2-U]
MSRKAFQRLSQDQRRRDLLEATLSCVAQHGLAGASVRRVAEAAGVSPGLIRHHFGTKDDMVRAAYAYMMGQLTSDIADASPASDDSPACRLARFIAASLTQPNLAAHKISLWATFIGRVRHDASYSAVHQETYREFLDLLAQLVRPVLSAHALPATESECQEQAIALNGLIDGLWLEGGLEHGLYPVERLPAIAMRAAEGILRLPQGTLLEHVAITTSPPPHRS